jgi:hypothetical protein
MQYLILLGIIIAIIYYSLIFLSVVLSVIVYPAICASAVAICPKYKGAVTGVLLLLTNILYVLSCTLFEDILKDWCYSVYAGVVLTPVAICYFAGLIKPSKESLSDAEIKYGDKKTILIQAFLVSLLFAIEGYMRFTESVSLYEMLNYDSESSPVDHYITYHAPDLGLVGILMLLISTPSVLTIGYALINYFPLYVKIARKNKRQKEHSTSNDKHISGAIVQERMFPPKNIEIGSNDSVANIKTLEDCFCDIIMKQGKSILKNENIGGIISSMYKELDIAEYKDLLKVMARDNFLYQFLEPNKQNDFVLFNLSTSYARQNKVNTQQVLLITQALVGAVKRLNCNNKK